MTFCLLNTRFSPHRFQQSDLQFAIFPTVLLWNLYGLIDTGEEKKRKEKKNVRIESNAVFRLSDLGALKPRKLSVNRFQPSLGFFESLGN